MEVEKLIQREYDPAHPNFERWQNARDISDERAKFVESVISEFHHQGLRVLDVGAGEGHTSKLFSLKNFVVSLEPKSERIKKIKKTNSLQPVMADSFAFPFKSSIFDLIILQDVIEHLKFTNNLIEDIKNLLVDDGIIYISTPNKFSILNIISDPHWGMPFLCLFRREHIKKYFLKYFRKNDYNRDDIAELLSLNEISKLFGKNFYINIYTTFSIKYLMDGGKGLIWSNFHLKILQFLKNSGLVKIIRSLANDKIGIINKYFTPTFYFILRKK